MYFPKMDPVFWAFTNTVSRKFIKIIFFHDKTHNVCLDVRETQMMMQATTAWTWETMLLQFWFSLNHLFMLLSAATETLKCSTWLCI